MNGFAVIILGFISFGILHTHTPNFAPWQWSVGYLSYYRISKLLKRPLG